MPRKKVTKPVKIVRPKIPARTSPDAVRDLAGDMLDQIRRDMAAVACDPVLTPDMRAKAYARLAHSLASAAKFTGEAGDIPEAKLLKLPSMRRVLDTILAALAPWPDALRACAEALHQLES